MLPKSSRISFQIIFRGDRSHSFQGSLNNHFALQLQVPCFSSSAVPRKFPTSSFKRFAQLPLQELLVRTEEKPSPKIEFLGRICLAHQGPRSRDKNRNFMQASFVCCFRHGRPGRHTMRVLSWDIWKNLMQPNFWA